MRMGYAVSIRYYRWAGDGEHALLVRSTPRLFARCRSWSARRDCCSVAERIDGRALGDVSFRHRSVCLLSARVARRDPTRGSGEVLYRVLPLASGPVFVVAAAASSGTRPYPGVGLVFAATSVAAVLLLGRPSWRTVKIYARVEGPAGAISGLGIFTVTADVRLGSSFFLFAFAGALLSAVLCNRLTADLQKSAAALDALNG